MNKFHRHLFTTVAVASLVFLTYQVAGVVAHEQTTRVRVISDPATIPIAQGLLLESRSKIEFVAAYIVLGSLLVAALMPSPYLLNR